jgi:hypothetical protein
MDVFETHDFTGTLAETEEMAPKWFSIHDLPWKEMWASDPLWYPYYMTGKYFKGEVVFDENHAILSSNIQEVS